MVEYLFQLPVSVVVASPQKMKCLDQHLPKPDQRTERNINITAQGEEACHESQFHTSTNKTFLNTNYTIV